MKNRGNAGKSGTRESLQQRSKYIDQSLEFLNWVNRLGLEKTIVGRVAQELDERFRVRRILLLFLFSLGLSFLLAFNFDFSYSLQPGDVASTDIKAPIGFQFVDEVATEDLRDQAAKKVVPVFDYDRGVFEDTLNRTYRAFRKMRDEARKVQWSKQEFAYDDQVRDFFKFKPMFEEMLGRDFSEREFEWLTIKKFNVQIENALVAILERWSQYRIIDSFDKNMPVGLHELNVRDAQGASYSNEYIINMQDIHDLAHEEDFLIDHDVMPKGLSTNDQTMLSILARSMVLPNITLNKAETNDRKKRAKEQIVVEKKLIEKNQVIVHEGAKVRPIDATILREIENQRSLQHRNFVALISAILFVVLLLVCFSYVRRFTLNRVVVEAKDIGIMGFVMLLTVSIAKLFLFLTNTAFTTKYGTMIPDSAVIFLAPVSAGAMLVGLLISAGELVWIFSLVLAIVVGFMVEEWKFPFFLVSVAGSIAGASGVFSCKKRNDIYMAGIKTGAVNALMIALVLTVQQFNNDDYSKLLIWSVPAGFLSGLISSMVAMMTVPMLETLFNCTTDVKLLELSNLNHPLMKDMIVRAPGTYHHSLVVGSMVEAAAEEIAANPLLAKVMSYYHDIGKVEHAGYFIENQKAGSNPHDHLSPHMSKTILIAHVKDGVELGLQYHLGKPIIDGIVQHHGTTLISFFHNRAIEQQDEDLSPISEEDFRYPGPKPQFREAALIMLADSIEAAARSLDEPTPVRLRNIVKNIIQRKFMDGQLDECNLTLRDLSMVEEAFIRILHGIYHQRIDYPKRAGGGAAETPKGPLPPTPPSGGTNMKLGPKRGSA